MPLIDLNENAHNEDFELVLDFWRKNYDNLFPMSELARKYLAIPSTTIESERLFS